MADPWFKCGDDEIAKTLQSTVEELERSTVETTRRNNLLYDAELYFGRKLSSLYEVSGGDYERLWNPESLVFNVCYSVVNTIRNRICSFRPRAQFLPNGGDYKAIRGARDQTQMSDAWAAEVGYQEEASLALRDMLTGDGGVLKLYKEAINGDKEDTVSLGRFPAWEFLFDVGESWHRKPECAYHVTYVPIEQASARYGVSRERLAAGITSMPAGLIMAGTRDLCRVVEGWKRGPIGGRHVTVVGDQVVGAAEDWQWDGFPLIVNTFDEGAVGVWGVGAITPIRAIQLELNEMQTTLREVHRNAAYKYIFYQQSEMPAKLSTNAYVQLVPFVNTPATIHTPPAIDSGIYQYIDLLKKQAFETIGVSQFAANGTRRPGATSAVAIQEESELQSDRLANVSQLWEGMRVDAATWWNRFAIDLARNGVVPKWKAIHRGAYKELVFGDLDAKWEIRPTPTSLFGQSMSGRLDKAVDLIKGGFMSKEDAMRALDLPDLAPIVDLALSQSYAMEWLVDDILENNVYRTPDDRMDPQALSDYVHKRYFLAIADESNYPAEHMASLNRFIDAVDDRLKALKAPPPAPPMQPQMAPPPMPPPPQLAPPPMDAPDLPGMQGAGPDALQQASISRLPI